MIKPVPTYEVSKRALIPTLKFYLEHFDEVYVNRTVNGMFIVSIYPLQNCLVVNKDNVTDNVYDDIPIVKHTLKAPIVEDDECHLQTATLSLDLSDDVFKTRKLCVEACGQDSRVLSIEEALEENKVDNGLHYVVDDLILLLWLNDKDFPSVFDGELE